MAKLSAEPVARQSTRTTRSQSREVSEALSSTIASPAKQKRGRKTNKQDLATVEEQDREESVALVPTTEEDEISDSPARRVSQYSAYSGTTAKTSFSQEEISDMDADIMMANFPNIASAAEDLARSFLPTDRTALRVIWKEIRTPTSKQSKLFKIRVQAFEIYSSSFGSQDYIQPNLVLRALFAVSSENEIPSGPWRPDSIIYKINLIRMMRNMLIMPPSSAEHTDHGLDDLANLDDLFLTAIAGSKLDHEALKMCLAIQTQVTLGRLRFYHADPSFSANNIISNVFMSIDEDDELTYKHMDAVQVDNKKQGQLYGELIQTRVEELRSAFQRPHKHAITTLRARFPWDDFVNDLIAYYGVRKQQFDEDIDGGGGAEQIFGSLAREVQRRADALAATAKRGSLLHSGSTPRNSAGSRAIARLKAREQEQRQAAQEKPQPVSALTSLAEPDNASQAHVDKPDDGFADVDDVVDQPHPPPTQASKRTSSSSRLLLAGFQQRQKKKVQRNVERARFTDAQPNAERLEWGDESQPTQHRPDPGDEAIGSVKHPTSQRARAGASKRTIAEVEEVEDEDDFEPTQDQGFQEDDRAAADADERRRGKAAELLVKSATQPARSVFAQAAASPQPRTASALRATQPSIRHQSSAEDSSRPRPTASTDSPSKRRRRNPGATIPPSHPLDEADDDEEIVSATQFERVKALAKQNRVHAPVRAGPRAGPQQRTAWSQDEEETLIDLIMQQGENGISYAQLKAADVARGEEAPLARRSAEDMRFKARNMKKLFILSRTQLPPNWEHVVLDKKIIDQLKARGIEYDQERIRGVA